MKKPNARYVLHFRWGDFQLNMVGRRTMLYWLCGLGGLIGLKTFGNALLTLLH